MRKRFTFAYELEAVRVSCFSTKIIVFCAHVQNRCLTRMLFTQAISSTLTLIRTSPRWVKITDVFKEQIYSFYTNCVVARKLRLDAFLFWVCLADSLTEWLNDRLTKWPTDWITEWLNDQLNDRLTEWLTEWRMTEWPTEWPTDRMTDWLNDDWLNDRLT